FTPEQIRTLRAWIDSGASWPKSATDETAGAFRKAEMQVTDRDRDHWAFRPLRQVHPPAVKNSSWTGTPIDSFILAALDAKGLAPAPESSKEKLIRRVY